VEFGDKVKNLRVDRGLTQTAFAERMGVRKSIISAYESQMRMPSLEMLVKIALDFSVSVDWLLGVERTKSIDVAGLTDEQVAILAGLVEEFRALNKK
jgi:transcriptional regulator with XRE-family HTH domain